MQSDETNIGAENSGRDGRKAGFICDPSKNVLCRKNLCVLRTGVYALCFTTSNREYAADADKAVFMSSLYLRKTQKNYGSVFDRADGAAKASEGAVSVIFDIDTSQLDKGREELNRIRNELHGIRRAAERAEHRAAKEQNCNAIYDNSTERIGHIDPETAKIRKHTHDILWAVLAGFAACGALVVVFGLIIIGILSYARG